MLSQFVVPNLNPILAEIVLLVMACALLLLSSFWRNARSSGGLMLFSLIALVATASVLMLELRLGHNQTTFGGMFVNDYLAIFTKLCVIVAAMVTLIYGRQHFDNLKLDSGEYYSLTLFATLGMMVMISGGNFVTLYLGLEMLSLSLYAMVAIDRDNARCTEAAMKFFVLGALASGLLLYGMSMLYGATGSLDLAEVRNALSAGMGEKQAVVIFGLVFVVAGLAFKLGVVPFHMWVPDVYQGASLPVTLLIASAPKLAALVLAMRLLLEGLFSLIEHWQQMLLILAMLSIAIGNLVAIAQTNIKRMFAYSGIAHMGFLLLALSSGVFMDAHGMKQVQLSVLLNAHASALYYAVIYVLMALGAFGMILLLSHNGREAEYLDDFKGLNQRSPWFAMIMLMLMFSMAGIPFFVGFFAKFAVLLALIQIGFVALAVIAVIFSLVGAFYYLRIVKLMYFDQPLQNAPVINASADFRLLLSLNGLLVVVLGVFPDRLMHFCLDILEYTYGHIPF